MEAFLKQGPGQAIAEICHMDQKQIRLSRMCPSQRCPPALPLSILKRPTYSSRKESRISNSVTQKITQIRTTWGSWICKCVQASTSLVYNLTFLIFFFFLNLKQGKGKKWTRNGLLNHKNVQDNLCLKENAPSIKHFTVQNSLLLKTSARHAFYFVKHCFTMSRFH